MKDVVTPSDRRSTDDEEAAGTRGADVGNGFMHAQSGILLRSDQPYRVPSIPGITVVVPVLNGARFLPAMLAAIGAQKYPGDVEIVAVDDGSTDSSSRILRERETAGGLRVIGGPCVGAAAAINRGIQAASHSLIAQVDQDVVIEQGWLEELVAALDDPSVAAAQGHYVAHGSADIWSRVMALDLRQRYARLRGRDTDHVCTGNSVYRKSALLDIGLFDESLGYGYDNDISYKLARQGYRLVIRPRATSVHRWREGLVDYARQQYGFGYGRIDLVSKHHSRLAGDDVSPWRMMIHAPAMLGGLGLLALAGGLAAVGLPSGWALVGGAGVVLALACERGCAGVRAAVRYRDRAGLFFAPVHLVRDIAWAAAIAVWLGRRLLRRPLTPRHSMAPRASQGHSPR
jgi:succinoglycan biosynthesis protein ExoA